MQTRLPFSLRSPLSSTYSECCSVMSSSQLASGRWKGVHTLTQQRTSRFHGLEGCVITYQISGCWACPAGQHQTSVPLGPSLRPF